MKFDNLKTWLYEVSRGYTLPMSLLPCLVAVACGYKLGGNVFYGILADQKADAHTNSTNQYARNNDLVEFLVDTRYLRSDVKKMGSAGIFEPLSGHITGVERIDFVNVPDPEPDLLPESLNLIFEHPLYILAPWKE